MSTCGNAKALYLLQKMVDDRGNFGNIYIYIYVCICVYMYIYHKRLYYIIWEYVYKYIYIHINIYYTYIYIFLYIMLGTLGICIYIIQVNIYYQSVVSEVAISLLQNEFSS